MSKEEHWLIRGTIMENPAINLNSNFKSVFILMFDEVRRVRESVTFHKTVQKELSDIGITLPVISDNFIRNNPIDEIVEKYGYSFAIMKLLLAAAEDNFHYDIESFTQAYNAVTEENILPYIAAGIFGQTIQP